MNKVFNRIESITGNVITVKAKGVQYKELAQINTRFGKSLAQVCIPDKLYNQVRHIPYYR